MVTADLAREGAEPGGVAGAPGPTTADDARDQAAVVALVHGYMVSQVIGVAARLHLADLLDKGPLDAAELAVATGTHQDSLHRLLRALESLRLVERAGSGRYQLSRLGGVLRSQAAAPAGEIADFFTSEAVWRPWGSLLHSVQTGQTAFEEVFGVPAFAYFGQHPQVYELFNAAMAQNAQGAAALIVEGCDFSRFRTVVDVGGGDGTLLSAVLAATPGTGGVLHDTVEGVRSAAELLTAAGVDQRCQVVAGDFFAEVPAGGDAYVLKSIIHDWDDAKSCVILRNCRRAMPDHGRLLLVEPVLPPQDGPVPTVNAVLSDLNMLVMAGGRERTEEDYAVLLRSAGLELVEVGRRLAPTDFRVLEAVPLPE